MSADEGAVIAIVGRPNVGKSTLFNRFVGERDAIVFDTPGVTRDRKHGRVEWAGTTFTVIDTGGFVPGSDDLFERAIREQAEFAIEEADAVAFVVDAHEGVTPMDAELARILRRSAKPIVLLVNKVDAESYDHETAEFFSLSLGEPHPIAALGGRGVGDVLDILLSVLPKRGKRRNDKRLKIGIVGKPNVGKSSLVNAIVGKKRQVVTPVPGTTRDPIDTVVTVDGEEYILIDTAGLRKRSKVTESIEFFSTLRTLKAVERSDVVVLMLDATTGVDKQDLHIVDLLSERRRPAVVAVNKWDLVDKETNTARDFEKVIRDRLGIHDYLPIVFVSALTKQRLPKIIEIARTVHASSRRRIATSKLNKTMIPEVERNPPKSSSPKEIRIKYVTQVRTDPPMFAFFCNEPKLIQEAYKRFLEHRLRDHFGFEGVPLTLTFRTK